MEHNNTNGKRRGSRSASIAVGERFGLLAIIAVTEERAWNQVVYLCRCDCGEEIKATPSHLKDAKSPLTHCGCLGARKNNKPAPGALGYKGYKQANPVKKSEKAALRALYSMYKQSARRRGHDFALTLEEFEETTTENCVYCGIPPGQVHKVGEVTYTYNGIDRINSEIGYLSKNIQPCCGFCNRAKGLMSEVDFLKWVSRVYTHMSESGKLKE